MPGSCGRRAPDRCSVLRLLKEEIRDVTSTRAPTLAKQILADAVSVGSLDDAAEPPLWNDLVETYVPEDWQASSTLGT